MMTLTHPALALIAPIAGVIMCLTVFTMPGWDFVGGDIKMWRDDAVYFEKCGYLKSWVRFKQKQDGSWVKSIDGDEFHSEAALRSHLAKRHDEIRFVTVRVIPPENLPIAELAQTIHALERTGIRRVKLGGPFREQER